MTHSPERTRDLDGQKGRSHDRPFEVGAPGFEPGTSASRTQRSTGLSHAPICCRSSRRVDRNAIDPEHALACELRVDCCRSSRQPDSNRRPQPWQGCALPAELCLRVLRMCFPPSHRSELNRRPLDYESSALPLSYGGRSGAGGTRTRDLLSAIQALSQTELRPPCAGYYGADGTRTRDLRCDRPAL